MTKEEILKYFEDINFYYNDCGRYNTLSQMIDKLLEQEPCDDAISRQAVINSIANTNFWLSSDNWDEIMKAINAIPSVKPQEPKTGHWKRIIFDVYECSICGQNVQTGDICAYKHCHGCGEKMADPQESEDSR